MLSETPVTISYRGHLLVIAQAAPDKWFWCVLAYDRVGHSHREMRQGTARSENAARLAAHDNARDFRKCDEAPYVRVMSCVQGGRLMAGALLGGSASHWAIEVLHCGAEDGGFTLHTSTSRPSERKAVAVVEESLRCLRRDYAEARAS
jgi:hypothetical protein